MLLASAGFLLSTVQVLQPSGNWVASFEPEHCQVERKFGSGSDETTVAFRPSIVDKGLEILIQRGPGRLRSVFQRAAEVKLMPGDQRFDATYTAGELKGERGRAYFIYTEQAAVTSASADPTLTVELVGEKIAIAPRGLSKAMSVLKQCRNLVAKHWGINPDDLNAISELAQPLTPEATWFRSSDYPSSAVRNQISGRSTILWSIQTDGSVSDCRTVVSSGSKLLDDAACKAVVNRGKYKPAHDISGRRVRSYGSAAVWWVPLS